MLSGPMQGLASMYVAMKQLVETSSVHNAIWMRDEYPGINPRQL